MASSDAAEFIRRHGGQLFVWPSVHRSFRLTLTMLECSTDPPARALEFRRVVVRDFLVFLHPAIRTPPRELQVELRSHRHPHVVVYWEGLAYVV